jgi:intracellular septation protein
MQLLADYFPLILFFIAFKWQGIYFATGVAIVASIARSSCLRWKRGRVAPVHWLSLAIIVVFGGATLILHDEVFIKWKPTVLYGLFGVISRWAGSASTAT